MANLLSWNLVTELGFKMKHLTKTEKFNLKSSSQLVENAIMGMLTLPIYIVLNSGCKTEEHKFAKIHVDFLVANPKIRLDVVILGMPFLNQSKTKIACK